MRGLMACGGWRMARGGRGSEGGITASRQDSLHSLELLTLQLAAGRYRPCKPAVHQRQQISSHSALIRVALKDLLLVLGVDRDLFAACVIAGALERAINPHLGAGAFRDERITALSRRLFERRLGLQPIHIDVSTRSVHRAIGK